MARGIRGGSRSVFNSTHERHIKQNRRKYKNSRNKKAKSIKLRMKYTLEFLVFCLVILIAYLYFTNK
jgi:hypothetical protein